MSQTYCVSDPGVGNSFSSLRADGEPTVTATLAPGEGVYEVSPRYGSVHLKALSMEAREVLTKFDRNGDGEVDESELENVIDVLVREQFKGRLFLCGILMVTFSLTLLLASSFGLTWAVIAAHKDTRVVNSTLVEPHTSQPVQTGASDYTITQLGALAARGAGVLATAPRYVPRPLTANMTTQLLSTLVRVSVTGRSGSQVGFRVTGFALYGGGSGPAGGPPALHIATPSGSLVVRGQQLEAYEAAAGLVEPGDLEGQDVTGIFKK